MVTFYLGYWTGIAMTQDDLQNLVDQLYREGINLEEAGEFYGSLAANRFSQDIGDEVESPNQDVPEDVQEALNYLAAQFHYAHIAELVVSGRLVEHSQDIPVKRLGVVLALSHVSYADAWGSYLAEQGQQTVRNEVLQQHFELLFDEERTLNILIGLCVIGAIAGRVIMEATQDTEDAVYNRIASFVSRAKHDDEQLITLFFDKKLSDSTDQDIPDVRQKADIYREHAVQIVMGGENPYRALGHDTQDIATTIGEQVNRFYQRIGIED